MVLRFCAAFLFCVLCYTASAESYHIDSIDKKMLKDANAVIRSYDLEIEVKELDNVVVREKCAITILNKKAKPYSAWREGYSQMKEVSKISAEIFDKDGKSIKKVKRSDFRKRSASSLMIAYYDDYKLEEYYPDINDYPYTIEYTVLTKYNNTFSLPRFVARPASDVAVVSAKLEIKIPANIELFHREFNLTAKPVFISGDRKKEYSWTVSGIAANKEETLAYEPETAVPSIFLSLSDFSLGNYKGSLRTWGDFGKFFYELNKGRDELPEDIKAKVREISSSVPDRRGKIALLYKYMQSNMRYVAVEIGIGGWQTLDANFLAKNQYGDCKALSNYMMALLRAASIEAYPALVMAGRELSFPLQRDFPYAHSFNHVILCAPYPKDTVWLECTSKDLPANYLGDFTADRDVLLVSENGGAVIHTPVYDTMYNIANRKAKGLYTKDGIAEITMQNQLCGSLAMSVARNIDLKPESEVRKFTEGRFRLPGYKLNSFNYKKIELPQNLQLTEEVYLSANSMVSATGEYTFFDYDLNPLNLQEREIVDNRKTDFYLPNSMNICDSFEVVIPEGYEIESLPEPVSSSHPFGRFYCSFTRSGNKVFIERRFLQNKGVYRAGLYSDYVKWLDAVGRTSDQRIVAKKI